MIIKSSLKDVYYYITHNKVEVISEYVLLGKINSYANHLCGNYYLAAIVKNGVGGSPATVDDIKSGNYACTIVDVEALKYPVKPIKLYGKLRPRKIIASDGFDKIEVKKTLDLLYNQSEIVTIGDFFNHDFSYTN